MGASFIPISCSTRCAAHDLLEKHDRLCKDAVAWPRLSETLKGPKHPEFCQKCGRTALEIDALGEYLQAWRERGQDGKLDPKESIFVMICTRCNKGQLTIVSGHHGLMPRMPAW